MKFIRQGMRGPEVRAVQVLLNALPVPGADLVRDGIFGFRTCQGVAAFQLHGGLMADGIVGPKTADALLGRIAGAGGS